MIKKVYEHKERYKCKDCVMFADEDADSAPYCLAKDLYTFVMGEDEACEEFVKWNGKKKIINKNKMEREKIVIELCGGKMPEKAHDADAAYDVFTKEDIIIKDWERYAIPLGFKMQLPKHLAAVIQPRSGMSSKGMYAQIQHCDGSREETRVDADVKLGLIDSGYTGEVRAILKTCCVEYLGVKSVCIPAGTKIAQMRIVEIPNTELVSGSIKKEEDNDNKRGDSGFNSTGVK